MKHTGQYKLWDAPTSERITGLKIHIPLGHPQKNSIERAWFITLDKESRSVLLLELCDLQHFYRYHIYMHSPLTTFWVFRHVWYYAWGTINTWGQAYICYWGHDASIHLWVRAFQTAQSKCKSYYHLHTPQVGREYIFKYVKSNIFNILFT